jgi:hypothetical protein
MGLAYNPGIDQQNHMKNKSTLVKRVEQLDHSLTKLQTYIETRMGEIEKSTQGYRDELIVQLKERFTYEQKKNERFAIEYAKLKKKYIDLLAKQKEYALTQSSNSAPSPATQEADNQARMSDPVSVAPKKSQAGKDRKKTLPKVDPQS